GKLLSGEFPITDIASIGVGVKGNLFGGQIDAALLGGILKLDSNLNLIDVLDTTTVVKKRVFFMAIEGGYNFAGLSGFTIRFALSELGPLGVLISVSTPGGIMIVPPLGLAINDFVGSVEFFKSLPSVENATDLRGPAFQLPTAVSVDNW